MKTKISRFELLRRLNRSASFFDRQSREESRISDLIAIAEMRERAIISAHEDAR